MTLNELNYKKLIDLSLDNVDTYTFDDYRNNGFRHPKACDYCIECEKMNLTICKDPKYYLCNISHGSHSKDFLNSAGITDVSDWNHKGVMFIMESPSKDYGIYEKVEIVHDGNHYYKHPSKLWYWIHRDQKITGYPDKFKGREYGDFVASAILTFRLSNAYMTNLIKCGLYDPDTDTYKGIDSYHSACIRKCYDEFLSKEIDIIKPEVIFTFGSKVNRHVTQLVGDNTKVVGLPHPAGQRRGFKDEYYNVLYFCMIAKWLLKTDVISYQFYNELMKQFAEAN